MLNTSCTRRSHTPLDTTPTTARLGVQGDFCRFLRGTRIDEESLKAPRFGLSQGHAFILGDYCILGVDYAAGIAFCAFNDGVTDYTDGGSGGAFVEVDGEG